MPVQTRHTAQQLFAHKLYISGNSHSDILVQLKSNFKNSASGRALSYWIKDFKTLDQKLAALDIPFTSNQIGEYDLPWESGEYLSDMWYEMMANPTIPRQNFSHRMNTNSTYLPTVREVKWWWRVHLIAKDFNYSDVYLMSVNYVIRELVSIITDTPPDYSDLDGFLNYKPWRDEKRSHDYKKAIRLGELSRCGEDTHSSGFIGLDIPNFLNWMWTQPVSSDEGKFFTPSKAFYIHYLISLGNDTGDKEMSETKKLHINITFDDFNSTFSEDELMELPVKARETINRIRWWQSQEQSKTNLN